MGHLRDGARRHGLPGDGPPRGVPAQLRVRLPRWCTRAVVRAHGRRRAQLPRRGLMPSRGHSMTGVAVGLWSAGSGQDRDEVDREGTGRGGTSCPGPGGQLPLGDGLGGVAEGLGDVLALEAWARSDWATGSARGILSCRPKMMRWRRAWKASPSLSWRPISRRWRWAPPGSPDRRRPSTKPGRAGRRSVRRPPPGSVTARHRPGPRHPTASPISHRTRAGRAYAQGAGPAAPQDEATVILQGNGRFPADDPACGNGPRSAPGAGNDHPRPAPSAAMSPGSDVGRRDTREAVPPPAGARSGGPGRA